MAERPGPAGIHSQIVRNVLKRVALAFDNFFRRIKEGQNAMDIESSSAQVCTRTDIRALLWENQSLQPMQRALRLLYIN
jgi:hypothetical protein